MNKADIETLQVMVKTLQSIDDTLKRLEENCCLSSNAQLNFDERDLAKAVWKATHDTNA